MARFSSRALAAGAMVLFAAAVAPRVHKVLDKQRARTAHPGHLPGLLSGARHSGGTRSNRRRSWINVAAGIVLAVIAGGFRFCPPGDDAAHQRPQ
jgi:hypothetical protein